MSVHVAILRKPYLDAILDGRKTIESRLSMTAGPPFDLVQPGERLYLKQSSGPIRGIATAADVHSFQDLTPPRIHELRRRFEPAVGGDDEYWNGRSPCRFATFVELGHVEGFDIGPSYKTQHMRAWYALPDAADPIREVTLTAGAVRHAYVPLPDHCPTMREQPFTLVLPDGDVVETDSYRGQRIRWRGWRHTFDEHGVRAGDRVRLTALGGRRYRVTFPNRP